MKSSPHSPLLAVPFPRWGTYEGLYDNSVGTANITQRYNFVMVNRKIFIEIILSKLHRECAIV
jgi:hypothetical protein